MGFRELLFVALCFWFSMALAAPARSCSCGTPLTVEESLSSSWVVFLGTVTATRTEMEEGTTYVVADFLVEGAWKGPVTREFSIATPGSSTECGYEFSVGLEYLVYAIEADLWGLGIPLPFTHLCLRTRLSENAQADLAELGPYTPLPVAAATWGRMKAMYKLRSSGME